MARKHKHVAAHVDGSSHMEKEHAFWRPKFTADPSKLGTVRVYRADSDGTFKDTGGNVMEDGMREENRKAP